MTAKDLTPKEAADKLTLEQLEELSLKYMENDLHVVRHRGQVEIARELRAIGTSNIADIMYEDDEGVVRMRPLTQLPRHVTAAIKKIKIRRDRVKGPRLFDDEGNVIPNHVDMTGEVVELELWDKNGALDKLMRHYGGYQEDNKQRGDAAAKGVGANLDLLMGAIAGQGLPQLSNENTPDDMWEEGEEDI